MNDLEKITTKFEEIYKVKPEVMARAPGRIEFIGNHTDYNLGTVIGSTINLEIIVAVARITDKNTNLKQNNLYFASEISNYEVVELSNDSEKLVDEDKKWINYPLGIYKTLKNNNLAVVDSFCYLVVSNLPLGAGLSSSAAIDLSTELALIELSQPNIGIDYDKNKIDIIKYAKESENKFVGISCGILDQGVCGYGNKSSLVHIDCKTLDFSLIPFPTNVKFLIFNTHLKHSLINSFYHDRHSECMMAAKALQVDSLADYYNKNSDKEVTFLNLFEKIKEETLAKRAFHVISEIKRVKEVKDLLESNDDLKLNKVGKLLIESHLSSKDYFSNSTVELDFLVDLLSKNNNVYGCRLTGGGFGGAVMAMTNLDFDLSDSEKINLEYKNMFEEKLEIIQTTTGEGMSILQYLQYHKN